MGKKKVLSKFMILCWAAFIAVLGCVQPAGHGLDTPYPNNWKNRVAICELEKTAKREKLRERSESPVLDIITLKCALHT